MDFCFDGPPEPSQRRKVRIVGILCKDTRIYEKYKNKLRHELRNCVVGIVKLNEASYKDVSANQLDGVVVDYGILKCNASLGIFTDFWELCKHKQIPVYNHIDYSKVVVEAEITWKRGDSA